MSLRYLVPVLCVVAACDVIIGVEPIPSWPCPDCVSTSCAAERSACDGVAGCTEWHACVIACGAADLACLVGCNEGFPQVARTDEARALARCRTGACYDACVHTEAWIPEVHPEGCAQCMGGFCAGEVNDCFADPDCTDALHCAQSCADIECLLHCVYDVGGDAAVDAISGLNDCFGDCGDACRAGQLYGCAGDFDWGTPADRTIEYTIRVSMEASGAAEGYELRACLFTPCDDPLDSDITDSEGLATVSLPVTDFGFLGHFEVFAPVGVEPIVPSRFEPGRPYTRSERRVGFPLFRPATLESVAELFDVELDPERGHIGWNAWDCMYHQARGLRVDIDADYESGFYLEPLGPVRDDGSQVTREGGAGSFINVEPGRYRILGTVDGELVLGDVDIEVYPGTLTGVHLHPVVR